MMNKKQKKTWPRKTVTIYTEVENVYITLRGLFRALHWDTAPRVNNLADMNYQVNSGRAAIAIYDDITNSSAFSHFQAIINNYKSLLTPTILLLREDSNFYRNLYLSSNNILTINKPITSSNIIPQLQQFFKKWETVEYQTIREANALYNNAKLGDAFNKLGSLLNSSISCYVLSIMGLILLRHGKTLESEAFLKKAIKKDSDNFIYRLNLAFFYQTLAQPHLAEEVYKEALKDFGNITAIYPNYIITLLSQRKFADAVSYLKELINDKCELDKSTISLAKIYSINGSPTELAKLNKIYYKRLSTVW